MKAIDADGLQAINASHKETSSRYANRVPKQTIPCDSILLILIWAVGQHCSRVRNSPHIEAVTGAEAKIAFDATILGEKSSCE